MITVKDFMEVVDYRITQGSEFQWTCWGDNAYTLDSWNGDQDGHTVSIIFDTTTQVVYMASAYDYKNQRAYRWLNPEFIAAYKAECSTKGCDDNAWDDVAYCDLEVAADLLEKARAIVLGQPYDTRVLVNLTLDDKTIFQLMQSAHISDMTLNKYVEQLLHNEMSRIKRAQVNDEASRA